MILADVKIPPTLPQWMKDHVDRYLKSDGKDGHMYTASFPNMKPLTVPSLLLVTKGRKSGEKHLFPLFYGTAGNGYYVVASKGGAPDHPGWYKNMLVHPEVEIQVGTKHLKARARTTSGAERQKLWDEAVKFWPSYADYQKKVPDREIPVVMLDPI
ncbi:MAG: nitroreductase family deazaflavin-dependent oxidoreductase [Enhydrobacter sp.]|nr:MAG: nitroreductase family deazaflavin-dependent oxidoreductase [Enhydrobacter sp.]